MISVDVYVMVHNEATLLPYFLRHYGSFARRIFAFEDQSTDGSQEILEQHPNVVIIEPEKHGINEKYWTSELWPKYEVYSRGQVDYVMQVDADEFIYHPNLLEVLEKEKQFGVQQIYCRGYTMIADRIPITDGQIYDQIKWGLPDKLSSKWAIFDPAIRLRYGDGRHRVLETTSAKSDAKTEIRILHYRWMGEQYFEERDKRNRKRFNIHDGVELEYDPKRRHNLPDGSRGAKLDWYNTHKGDAVDVT